jgi:hypothetical protein
MKSKQIPQLDHFSSMSPSRYDTLVAFKHPQNKIEEPMDRRATFRRKDCNSDVSSNTFLIDQRYALFMLYFRQSKMKVNKRPAKLLRMK